MIIFDMVVLNMDRHGDNFLVSKPSTENGNSQLVPIDNGLAFPTRDGFFTRSGQMLRDHAIGMLPQASEMFDEQSLSLIDSLNIEEVISEMKDRMVELEQQHKELSIQRLGPQEETFEMMRRSVAFMKAAAKKLTPAKMQKLLIQKGEEIFSTPHEELERTIGEMVNKAARDEKAWSELSDKGQEVVMKYFCTAFDSGWGAALGNPKLAPSAWYAWASDNAVLLVDVVERELKNEKAEKFVEERYKQFSEIQLALKEPPRWMGNLANKTTLGEKCFFATSYEKEFAIDYRKVENLKKRDELRKSFPKSKWPDEDNDSMWDLYLSSYHRFQEVYSLDLEIDGIAARNMDFLDLWMICRDAVNKHCESSLESLQLSSEWQEMCRFEFVDISNDCDYDEALEQINLWREFKSLGAWKALNNCREVLDPYRRFGTVSEQ